MSKLIITKDLVTAVDTELDWYAFVTVPQKQSCAHILRRRGIATFIPTETRWRSTNRYTKRRKLKEANGVPGRASIPCRRVPAGVNAAVVLAGRLPVDPGRHRSQGATTQSPPQRIRQVCASLFQWLVEGSN